MKKSYRTAAWERYNQKIKRFNRNMGFAKNMQPAEKAWIVLQRQKKTPPKPNLK